MDDAVGVVYKERVLRKRVWVKIDTDKIVEGVIARWEAFCPDDDPNNTTEYKHYVLFGNGEGGYYDLTQEELTENLFWTRPANHLVIPFSAESPTTNNQQTTGSATPSRTHAASRTNRVVTPARTGNSSRTGNENNNPTESSDSNMAYATVKPEPDDHADISSDQIHKKEFEHWLRHIHKGARGNGISDSNVRSVLNRTRDLISGAGITYKNWPHGVIFHQGQKIDLNTDFE